MNAKIQPKLSPAQHTLLQKYAPAARPQPANSANKYAPVRPDLVHAWKTQTKSVRPALAPAQADLLEKLTCSDAFASAALGASERIARPYRAPAQLPSPLARASLGAARVVGMVEYALEVSNLDPLKTSFALAMVEAVRKASTRSLGSATGTPGAA